uniref:Uncharacterized protein n=1 Tax=Meloidogyne hapla TaxID=6305 RepID=A0A1I8BE67_MELHA
MRAKLREYGDPNLILKISEIENKLKNLEKKGLKYLNKNIKKIKKEIVKLEEIYYGNKIANFFEAAEYKGDKEIKSDINKFKGKRILQVSKEEISTSEIRENVKDKEISINILQRQTTFGQLPTNQEIIFELMIDYGIEEDRDDFFKKFIDFFRKIEKVQKNISDDQLDKQIKETKTNELIVKFEKFTDNEDVLKKLEQMMELKGIKEKVEKMDIHDQIIKKLAKNKYTTNLYELSDVVLKRIVYADHYFNGKINKIQNDFDESEKKGLKYAHNLIEKFDKELDEFIMEIENKMNSNNIKSLQIREESLDKQQEFAFESSSSEPPKYDQDIFKDLMERANSIKNTDDHKSYSYS